MQDPFTTVHPRVTTTVPYHTRPKVVTIGMSTKCHNKLVHENHPKKGQHSGKSFAPAGMLGFISGAALADKTFHGVGAEENRTLRHSHTCPSAINTMTYLLNTCCGHVRRLTEHHEAALEVALLVPLFVYVFRRG